MSGGFAQFSGAKASAILTLAAAMVLATSGAGAQPPRQPSPLSSTVSMRDAAPEDAAWPLAEATRRPASINFLEKLSAPSLKCTYRRPGGGGRAYSVSFWENSRPDLRRMSGPFPIELDMAVPACPATWGDAVTLGWGNGAWEEAAKTSRAEAQARNEEAARDEARARETPESRKRDWLAQAAALPKTTEASDLALARQIDADISALESRLDSLNSRPFNDRLVNPGGLFERINRLGQIAYVKAKSLNPQPTGRAAFDAWDERLGGPAVSAVARLEKIVYYRQYRRVRMNEISGDAGQSEMASWANVDFNPVYTSQTLLMEVYARHLNGRPTIDPDFQRRIAQDLQRLRPSGDPGRPYRYHVPAEPKPTWMMTPDEEDGPGGKMISNGLAIVNGVGDLIRLVEKVDADVRESRVAFWKCYAARCPQAAEAFYAYSYAMWTKDNFYFAGPALMPVMLQQGMSFLGMGSIDGGPIAYCAAEEHQLAGALAEAVNKARRDPVATARSVVATMKGPAYAKWQGCRDRMEYVLRPRFL